MSLRKFLQEIDRGNKRISLSRDEVIKLIGKPKLSAIIRQATKAAKDQTKDWPDNDFIDKIWTMTLADLYLEKQLIMIFGGMRMKDGHSSDVVVEVPFKLSIGKVEISENGING